MNSMNNLTMPLILMLFIVYDFLQQIQDRAQVYPMFIPLYSAACLRVMLVEQSMSSFLSAKLTGQY